MEVKNEIGRLIEEVVRLVVEEREYWESSEIFWPFIDTECEGGERLIG